MPSYTTTKIDAEVDLRIEEEGAAAAPPKTVFEVFEETVKKHGTRPAMYFKKIPEGGKAATTPWTVYTWSTYYDLVFSFAKSLISLGFKPHRVINIIGFNSPEWFIANCGAIAAGGVAAGVYTTNGPDSCKYISGHSEAEVVVVENRKQLDKFVKISADLPHLKALVMWSGDAEGVSGCRVPIYTWDQFLDLGKDVPTDTVKARIAAQKPGHCCTLIYTSGTTGPPKAVMVSHDNITWTVYAFLEHLGFPLTENDRNVSYLPLSHVAAQMVDIHAAIYSGLETYFAQPDALKGSLAATLREVRPTSFLGVPRVWEKIKEKMTDMEKSVTGIKGLLSSWAKARGLAKCLGEQYGHPSGKGLGYMLANALVLSKVKEALGLDQAKICVSSAAPISPDVLEYFAALDIPVMELFGASECTGPHTSNVTGLWKIGSIGKEMPGVKSRIAEAGEWCLWGRHVMMGYMKSEDKTKEAITEDGWLRTGDVADKDEDGFWKITGRIKELIITAGGENIPPVLIENEIKAEIPSVSHCVVIGDRRKFLTVLLTLKTKVDKDTGLPSGELNKEAEDESKALGSDATTVEQVAKDPLWKKYLDDSLKKVNARATSNAQCVQKWAILPSDFSEKGGELTPTLKLKRAVVAEKYKDVIEKLYQGGGQD